MNSKEKADDKKILSKDEILKPYIMKAVGEENNEYVFATHAKLAMEQYHQQFMEDNQEERINELEKERDYYKSLSVPPEPHTGEMWSFLLVNSIRLLTQDQQAGLCFDLYERNDHKELIDDKIQQLKNQKQ